MHLMYAIYPMEGSFLVQEWRTFCGITSRRITLLLNTCQKYNTFVRPKSSFSSLGTRGNNLGFGVLKLPARAVLDAYHTAGFDIENDQRGRKRHSHLVRIPECAGPVDDGSSLCGARQGPSCALVGRQVNRQ